MACSRSLKRQRPLNRPPKGRLTATPERAPSALPSPAALLAAGCCVIEQCVFPNDDYGLRLQQRSEPPPPVSLRVEGVASASGGVGSPRPLPAGFHSTDHPSGLSWQRAACSLSALFRALSAAGAKRSCLPASRTGGARFTEKPMSESTAC